MLYLLSLKRKKSENTHKRKKKCEGKKTALGSEKIINNTNNIISQRTVLLSQQQNKANTDDKMCSHMRLCHEPKTSRPLFLFHLL